MDLSERWLPWRIPRQFFYVGENHLDLFCLPHRASLQTRRWPGTGISGLTPDFLRAVQRDLPAKETGLILHPGLFVFNIFEFDRLPWKSQLRRELVEWRLQKIFPEEIALYEHRYSRVGRHRLLSVLIRKNWLESLASLFAANDLDLTYVGSSTLEILNRLGRRASRPDCLIETDGSTAALVLLQRGAPAYVRKFKVESGEDLAEEIRKTLQFAASAHRLQPRSYLWLSHSDLPRNQQVQAELLGQGLQPVAGSDALPLFIPRP